MSMGEGGGISVQRNICHGESLHPVTMEKRAVGGTHPTGMHSCCK